MTGQHNRIDRFMTYRLPYRVADYLATLTAGEIDQLIEALESLAIVKREKQPHQEGLEKIPF